MYADRRIKLRAHHRRSGAPRILTPDGSLGRACEVRLLVTGGPLGVVVGVDGARISGGAVGVDHVPRQVVGRISGSGKLGTVGSASPRWTCDGRFQASASWGRMVLNSAREASASRTRSRASSICSR